MLRRIQFQQRLLQGGGVDGNVRPLHQLARRGQPGVGLLNPLLDGRELPGFKVGELLFASRSACRLFLGVLPDGRGVRLARLLVLGQVVLLFHPVFPLRIVGKAAGMAAPIQPQHRGCHAVQQVAVVGYQNQRAGKIEQVFFQNLQRGNVQIVGGLVQQQHVGRLQHQLGNQHPRPLAATEIAHRLIQLLAGKQEAGRPTGHMHHPALVQNRVALWSQGAAQGQTLVQLAHLAEIDQAQGLGAANVALGGLDLSPQQAQEGGFAAAVRSHQAHFHPRGEHEVQTRKQPPAGQILFQLGAGLVRRFAARHIAGHIVEFYQPFGLAQAGLKVDARGVDRGARVHLLQLADQVVGGVDARFGFGCSRLGTAPEPLDFGLHLVAQALLLFGLRLQVGLLLLKKPAEVAFDAQQPVGIDAIQLDDRTGSGFQEIAVVADGDGGEGSVAQQLFQPLYAGQVEVVGGLVQQHDFGFDDHGLGDGQPLAPAAAERGRLGVQVGKAGAAGQLAQPALALVFVHMGGGQRLLQHLADAQAGGKARVLGNIGGAGALAHRQLAGVGLNLPGQYRQQRGLARSVGADQADAVAVIDGEGNIEKQRLGAELLGHGLRVENRRHLS